MSAIGPGDWVECVDAGPCPKTGKSSHGLTKGSIYQVLSVSMSPHWDVSIVTLVEVAHPDEQVPGAGFGAYRFRPIYRPSADLIASLLRPVPADRVDA